MIDLFIKFWPLILATLLYLAQLSIFVWTKNWGGAITFLGYAMANIGLIWSYR